MKQTLLIILFYFSPLLWACLFNQKGAGGEVFAQYRKLDSLKTELQNHPAQDLKHLQLLQLIAEAQEFAITRDGIITADKAIAIAKKLNNQKELAAAYNMKARLKIYDGEYEVAKQIADSAFAINKAIKNQLGLADNFLTNAIVNNLMGEMEKNKSCLDTAMLLLKPFSEIKLKGRIEFNYGLYYMLSNVDSSKHHFNNSIKLFELIGDSAWLANSLTCMARNYINVEKPDLGLIKNQVDKISSLLLPGGYNDFCALQLVFIAQAMSAHSIYALAIEYLNEALPIAEKANNLQYIGYVYFNLAMTYQSLANYPQAISYYHKYLTIAEKRKNELEISAAMSNIGMIYRELKNYDVAFKYFQDSYKMGLKFKNKYMDVSSLEEIGYLHLLQGNLKEAFRVLQNSLKIANEIKADDHIAICYGFLGEVYAKLNKPDSAFFYFNNAAALNKKMGVTLYYAENLISISRTIKDLPDYEITDMMRKDFNPDEKFKKAIEYANEALTIVKETGEVDIQRDACLLLSELYEKENNTASSFKFYKQYVLLNDSILNTENTRSIANLQMQYDSEKQEQQIASLTKDKALHQTEIEKQKTTRNAFIGGLVLMLLLAGVTYNRYRMKQKANTKIENTLTHLKNSQEQLVQQGKLAALGKMTAEVAVEIQTPLNVVKQFSNECELLVEQFSNSKNETEQNQILDKLELILETINQNGKMADGIVKNVLMQSRR